MKVCIVSHCFPPHPEDELTRVNLSLAKYFENLVDEVHVVTNHAWFGSTDPEMTSRFWKDGKVFTHRLPLLDEGMNALRFARFFDVDPFQFQPGEMLWAGNPFNLAAFSMAAFVETLHIDIHLDFVLAPYRFAPGFYMARRRKYAREELYPPIYLYVLGDEDKEKRETSISRNGILKVLEDETLRLCDGMFRVGKNEGGEPTLAMDDDGKAMDFQSIFLFFKNKAEKFKRDGIDALTATIPSRLKPSIEPSPIPGNGVILIDCIGAGKERAEATVGSIKPRLGVSPRWKPLLLVDEKDDPVTYLPWRRVYVSSEAPWKSLEGEEHFVYVKAGTRLEDMALDSLLEPLVKGETCAGTFLWVRPSNIKVFPYLPDFDLKAILSREGPLPACFATWGRVLADFNTFKGMDTEGERIALLLCHASSKNGGYFRHGGWVYGDYYAELPSLDRKGIEKVKSRLSESGLLPGGIATEETAIFPRVIEDFGEKEEKTVTTHIPIEELERVYREHQALKNLKIVKLLKKLGILSIARKIFPGIKKAIGPG